MNQYFVCGVFMKSFMYKLNFI